MFSRVTLVAATEVLGAHSHASFNQMVVRLELEDRISDSTTTSIRKKCAALARIVVQRRQVPVETLEGETSLGEAVVREAVAVMWEDLRREPEERFERSLARDGYSLAWDKTGKAGLRPTLPVELGAETDDEVHHLLEKHSFRTSRRHLDQALDAHSRGDWEAANGQLRSFMEGLFDEIATMLYPEEAAGRTPANRRTLLGGKGFLSKARNEWTDDGKNYVNGLFKLLHPEGPHSGLSDMEHSTFRLHLVLATARAFLRRLDGWEDS